MSIPIFIGKRKINNKMFGLQHQTWWEKQSGRTGMALLKPPSPLFLPSKRLCRPSDNNLRTLWRYTSYIPLQKCVRRIAEEGTQNIRKILREKRGEATLKVRFSPSRSLSRLVNLCVLGVRGRKKSGSDARAVVGQLSNQRRRGFLPKEIRQSCL